MRAYQLLQGTGIDGLVEADLPMPKPGPGQVLVKVAACSLNFRDLAIALGTYRMPVKPNLIPVSDGAPADVAHGGSLKAFFCKDILGGFEQSQFGIIGESHD